MGNTHHKAFQSALEWYVDQGVDEALDDAPIDRTQIKAVPMPMAAPAPSVSVQPNASIMPEITAQAAAPLLGKSDAREEAVKLAAAASTLEELKEAIAEFEGLSLKKTATNLVFSDGNPEAPIMLVGEAPGADEDRIGKPFVGQSGELLDRILKCINLGRAEEDTQKAVYIANILNWRPPGNRTPSPAEIEVSLPFIEKHIALVKPKILILCGGVPAKALLGRTEGISRLRKTWHDYKPQTKELGSEISPISAIATYHPDYLLSTPGQKKAVWADMLSIDQKLKELGLRP